MPITLKSGRTFKIGGAGNEIIGISADLEVTVGYDDGWHFWPSQEVSELDWYLDEPPLSPAEKVEVCEMIIDRWRRLADKIKGEEESTSDAVRR